MITEKHLRLVRSCVAQTLDPRQLQERLGGIEHHTDVILPMNMDAIVIRTISLFAAEDLKKVDIAYPCDWWEAIKERWFPAWALRKWPVQRVRHLIDIAAIWQRFSPDPSILKHGPFIPYVYERTIHEDTEA